jgi:maltokinase
VLFAPATAEGDVLRRARAGDGVVASLLDVLAAGGIDGLDTVYAAELPAVSRDERAMGVDQSNESLVIGERVVIKLFPRAVPGANVGVDAAAHLAATGFTETPAALGAIAWRGIVVASVAALVPGSRDGWEWYVELVQDAATKGDWGEADAAASLLGGLVARLHIALAIPSHVLPSPTGTADALAIRRWHARALTTLERAVEVTPDDAGERLSRLAPRARAVIDRLRSIERTPVQRVHGDLHVGQILRDASGALWVHDFDGNPLEPPGSRASLDAAARDVTAMAGAIDHVGRVVVHRLPDTADAVADWIERARAAFLSAYRSELGPHRALYDDRLLHPFAVEQEAHEFCYASAYLPRWRYVPDAAMPAAIARAEADA